MKKIISVMLAVVMIFSLDVPAFAKCTVENKTPVIYISGDGNALWYDNDTKSFEINDMLRIYGNSEDGSISEAAFNILYPLIMKGIVSDDWDDYYDALLKK